MPSGASGEFDLIRLLDALLGVHFIIIGGVAATLHGSPRLTFDLDIVPEASDANLQRLQEALQRIDARVRDPARRRIPLSGQLLRASRDTAHGGQLRLRTRHGPVDILWRLHDGRDYDHLEPSSVELSDNERSVAVLEIDTLINVKRSAGRPRDQQDVEILETIRRRK